MAQLHMMTIETKAIMERPNKGLPIEEGWFDEIEQFNLELRPSHFELVEQTPEKQIVKVTMDINTSIILPDEEYKAWKNVDWWEEFDYLDMTIKVLYDEKFEVVNHDCEWIDDSELDE